MNDGYFLVGPVRTKGYRVNDDDVYDFNYVHNNKKQNFQMNLLIQHSGS